MATADDLRAISLALPQTEERITWDVHPTFRVREKIFAILSEDDRSARVKATLADQAALIATDPKTFAVAPHVGRYGWVTVQLSGIDRDHLEELLTDAWRRTAPKRLAAAFDTASG